MSKYIWIALIIVIALVVLWVLIKFGGKIANIFRKPELPPDPAKDQEALSTQLGKIDSASAAQTGKIDANANAKKKGVDAGSPTPAQVFDEAIKSKKP